MKKLVAILILSITPFCCALQLSNSIGWSGSPTITTGTTDYNVFSVAEGLVDPRVCISQTFKVNGASSLKLDKIAIFGSNDAPTASAYTLRLVDIGTTDPGYQSGGSQTYAAGTDLWGQTLSFTYNSMMPNSVLQFDFQGVEELTLTHQHYYAFEITASSPIGGLWWFRAPTSGSVYLDGAMFVDTLTSTPGTRDQLYKGTIGRDLAMAVYLIPEPATLLLFAVGGWITFRKK